MLSIEEGAKLVPLGTLFLPLAMSMKLVSFFTEHPNSINESYCQHLLKASCFSWSLFVTALACLVHAFLPFIFVDSASKNVAELYESINRRGKK